MGAILITAILLLIIVVLLYVYLTWNFNYWKKLGVRGPKPILLLGTLPNALMQSRNLIYDYNDHYKKFKNTDSYIGNFTIRTPELMILTPQLAKEVTVTQFRKFQDNYFSGFIDAKAEPILGNNPFMLKGQEWKEKRAEITPALTANRVKASFPVMQKVGNQMVEFIKQKLQAEGKDYVFDCRELTQRYTIQNVADSVYGIDAGALDLGKESELLRRSIKLMDDLFKKFALLFILCSIPIVNIFWKVKFMPKESEEFFVKLMRDAIELRKRTHQEDRVDFLNYLMQLKEKKGLTNVQLQGHSITFFLDGFETSATVLAHVMLCLGRHKTAQNKLREEIEINTSEDGTIGFDKLLDLPYLDQCLSETLRLFPPGSFTQKICTEATELENPDGSRLSVAKGTPITIPIYCFHHDEDIYPHADRFDPERFSAENGGGKNYRDMGAYLPFGEGPRTCLGQKFAITQIKAALVELVRNFEISVNEKTRRDNVVDPKNIILYLDGGIWCTFKELKN